jgi:hypothetical protein
MCDSTQRKGAIRALKVISTGLSDRQMHMSQMSQKKGWKRLSLPLDGFLLTLLTLSGCHKIEILALICSTTAGEQFELTSGEQTSTDDDRPAYFKLILLLYTEETHLQCFTSDCAK